jgi:hypothetical protein
MRHTMRAQQEARSGVAVANVSGRKLISILHLFRIYSKTTRKLLN